MERKHNHALLMSYYLQVSEERLISLLEQINTQTTKQTKVTVSNLPRSSPSIKCLLACLHIVLSWFGLLLTILPQYFRSRGAGVCWKMMISYDVNLCVKMLLSGVKSMDLQHFLSRVYLHALHYLFQCTWKSNFFYSYVRSTF